MKNRILRLLNFNNVIARSAGVSLAIVNNVVDDEIKKSVSALVDDDRSIWGPDLVCHFAVCALHIVYGEDYKKLCRSSFDAERVERFLKNREVFETVALAAKQFEKND